MYGYKVKIRVGGLTESEKKHLSEACDYIDRALRGHEYEKTVRAVMNVVGFVSAKSSHVSAGYSGWVDPSSPVIILSAKMFKPTYPFNEFIVTVLHEVLHLIFKPGDEDSSSKDEALHDLGCYEILGIVVPENHWALQKFPELKGRHVVLDFTRKEP